MLRRREGLLLEIEDAGGGFGQGEASPLPGFSSDTLATVRSELARVKWRSLSELDPEPARLDSIERVLDEAGLRSPSARFAAETALLDLAGQQAGRPVHELLEPRGVGLDRRASLPLAALLAGDVLADAREKVDQGYRVLKVKVGRSPAEELPLLASLRDTLGGGIALRADANANLTPEEAPGWLRSVAALELQFVEEPVPLREIASVVPSPVPLALDESLRPEGEPWDVALRAALEEGGYRYVVLKPAYHGGAIRCIRLAELARRHGAEPVVSHLFDGPVALTAAAELALALRPSPAAGLAPHAGLAPWPAVELPAFGRAELNGHDRPGLGLPRFALTEAAHGWTEVGR